MSVQSMYSYCPVLSCPVLHSEPSLSAKRPALSLSADAVGLSQARCIDPYSVLSTMQGPYRAASPFPGVAPRSGGEER
jgi:hypothetical protein